MCQKRTFPLRSVDLCSESERMCCNASHSMQLLAVAFAVKTAQHHRHCRQPSLQTPPWWLIQSVVKCRKQLRLSSQRSTMFLPMLCSVKCRFWPQKQAIITIIGIDTVSKFHGYKIPHAWNLEFFYLITS